MVAPRKSSPPDILTLDEVVAKNVFEKEFATLKKELEAQHSITWQVVIGVAFAFILAVGVIVSDAIISRNTYLDGTSAIGKEINGQALELNNLKNAIDNLRARNPYLK